MALTFSDIMRQRLGSFGMMPLGMAFRQPLMGVTPARRPTPARAPAPAPSAMPDPRSRFMPMPGFLPDTGQPADYRQAPVNRLNPSPGRSAVMPMPGFLPDTGQGGSMVRGPGLRGGLMPMPGFLPDTGQGGSEEELVRKEAIERMLRQLQEQLQGYQPAPRQHDFTTQPVNPMPTLPTGQAANGISREGIFAGGGRSYRSGVQPLPSRSFQSTPGLSNEISFTTQPMPRVNAPRTAERTQRMSPSRPSRSFQSTPGLSNEISFTTQPYRG